MKILVADDDAMTRLALIKNIEKWGYEVVAVEDGTLALEALSGDDPPRIAILDWLMPGREGIDICRELTRSDNAPLIYTILLTIKTDKADIVEALDQGACDFLSKPVHVGELRSRIAVGVRLVKAEDQIREYAKEMERLAISDPLTGAANRRHFFNMAQQELKRAKRYDKAVALIMMDIDFFKKINDTYGHQTGDEALKALVACCRPILRESDLLARFGGEEFCLLLPETGIHQAGQLAERLRGSMENLRMCEGDREFGFTVSMGVAEVQKIEESIDAAIKRADGALYEAKTGGRNKCVVRI
ncbi:MAG: diguanylate cyclase [Pseudomonadota bacterium]